MIPSSTKIQIAPFANSDYVNDRLNFWKSVYGFNMLAMQDGPKRSIYTDGVIRPQWLCGKPCIFKELNMYKAELADLSFSDSLFTCAPRSNTLDGSTIDGLAIWFDAYFSTERDRQPSENQLILRTGPHETPTHWGQSKCISRLIWL